MRKSPWPRSQEVSAAHLPFLWQALQQRRQDLRLPGPLEDRHEGLRLLGLEGLAQDALQQALVLQRLARDGYLEALDHVAMREEVRELVQLLKGTQVHGARKHRIDYEDDHERVEQRCELPGPVEPQHNEREDHSQQEDLDVVALHTGPSAEHPGSARGSVTCL